MGYILAEILACLLLAWLLGALLGWWLRGGCSNDNKGISEAENEEIKKRYENDMQSKQDFYNSKVKSIEESYLSKLQQQESQIKNLESSYISKIEYKDKEIKRLEEEIDRLKNEHENLSKQSLINNNINKSSLTPIVTQKDKEKCYELEEIQGIGPGFALRLKKRGIFNSCYLANKFLYDDHETNKLSRKLEINFDTIKAWASMADLMKVDGISSEYAEILQEVGINTRYELAKADANDLSSKIKEYRQKYPNGPDIPDLEEIRKWIDNLQIS